VPLEEHATGILGRPYAPFLPNTPAFPNVPFDVLNNFVVVDWHNHGLSLEFGILNLSLPLSFATSSSVFQVCKNVNGRRIWNRGFSLSGINEYVDVFMLRTAEFERRKLCATRYPLGHLRRTA
jgi:hypothetical protein